MQNQWHADPRGPGPSKLQSLHLPICEMGTRDSGVMPSLVQSPWYSAWHTQQLFLEPMMSRDRSGRGEGGPSVGGSRASLTGQKGRRRTMTDNGACARVGPTPVPQGRKSSVPAET